ncbi:hypothetical protein MBLNU457_g2466t1 [Dothideomycetes sp. NU457]
MAYGKSLTWKHPRVIQYEARSKLNRQRGRFCPRSDSFTLNFDIAKHREEYAQLLHDYRIRKTNITEDEFNVHWNEVKEDKEFRAGREDYRPRPKREPAIAFNGKDFADTRGTVLACETIWAPNPEQAERPIAEWPVYQEMKFEGDDRMRSDKLHRRFLPLPRVPANETVLWSQRAVVQSYEWDEQYRPLSDEDVVFLHNRVEGEEAVEEGARHVLGEALLSALDPVDAICV